MKNKIGRFYLILGIIATICGLYMLLSFRTELFLDLGFSENLCLLLGILGGVVFLLGCGLLSYYLILSTKLDKMAEIEEKDERNIAIRGKAAEILQLVTAGTNLILMIVFLILSLDTAALLLAGAMLIQIFISLAAFVYYNKKM